MSAEPGPTTTTVVMYHPSAVLRADERGGQIRTALIDDLRPANELSHA